jgi:phospholipid transport system substrate-binding protein
MRSALTLIAALFLMLVPAAAQSPAESFVSKTVTDGFAILNNTSLPVDARGAQLEKLLLSATDLNRIALFTLGSTTASDAQRSAFIAAFRTYALSVYRTHFLTYAGRRITVTGSRQNAPGDMVVHATLSDPNGGAAVPMDFRVRTDGPSPVIIDIGFAGIWLALTQRDDFAAYLGRNGGDVAKLTSYLEGRAKAAP